LNDRSLIVAAMKRAILLTALTFLVAGSVYAQTSEIGILIGGSRRFIESEGTPEPAPTPENPDATRPFLANEFSFSNSSIDLYWSWALDEETRLKVKVGRIEGPVSFEVQENEDSPIFRRDVEGEVQHAALVVDYRFDEPWGSTGLFGGLGLYRTSGEDEDGLVDSYSDYGFQFGVNADFPINRTYGVILEGTYHWTRGPFEPKYVTLSGGLRFAF
jgi:hypothetical protein